jgi:predicted secreted protein
VDEEAFAPYAQQRPDSLTRLLEYSNCAQTERRSNTMSDIVEVGEQQNGKQIEVIRGQTLRVTLPEVRTAGFRWSLRTSSQQILAPLADNFDGAPATAGGAALHHWDFRAAEVGTTDLFFECDRPWARAAEAARTFSVSVRVTETSSNAAHQAT